MIKQKIQVKAQRIRRYDKRSKFYRQNLIFRTDAKRFYREIGRQPVIINEPPQIDQIEDFWRSIWSNSRSFNTDAVWLNRENERTLGNTPQEWSVITASEISEALLKAHKWKTPGVDKIPNFWMHTLTSVHTHLAKTLSYYMNNPTELPAWVTEGVTYLLAKSSDTKKPQNFRPITCLTTTYKLLTSILTNRMYTHIEQNDILPTEQKGCRRNSYGCRDQLMVNRMILENCRARHRNLSTAWIDYQKAFDSVPHGWILKAMELYKFSPVIIKFLKHSMSLWKTRLFLHHSNGTLESKDIPIKCGIFQGDSLSPLLFCLALTPLSAELHNTTYGYKINNAVIDHLFYMDDLKLYAKDDSDLEGLLQTVKRFSDDIGMQFGLSKCAKATFKRGKLVSATNIHLDLNTTIRELEQNDTYKYLGIDEGDGIQHSLMKERLRKEYYRRVRAILKSELNSKNCIEAINTLAVPVVQYSFNIINWNMADIRRMDVKTRKLLTNNRMHHPKADIDRLYLPRRDGGWV